MSKSGPFVGSARKSEAQVKALTELGIEMEIYNNKKKLRKNFMTKITTRLPFTSVSDSLIYDKKLNGADLYYIRFNWSDWPFSKFVQKLRKNNPKAKIILELPDIDYIHHLSDTLKNFPYIIKDKLCWMKISKCIDRIAIMSKEKFLHEVPCIKILNGIDLSIVDIRKISIKNHEIHCGAVASLQKVHGYDRFINGLGDYYQNGGNREVKLHIIGDGEILEELKDLCKKRKMENNVFFHGYLFGEKLDEMYDKLDIGICELAPGRRAFELSSSLKSREYLAKGLPVATASKIDVFEENKFDYVLDYSDGEGSIDIQKIIEFYDAIYFSLENSMRVRDEIRNYAEKYLSIHTVMRPVVNYVLGNNFENRRFE